MAETPEAAVKREIRRILGEHLQRAPVTGGYGRSGQLDFVCCVNGYYLAIEAKSIRSKYGKNGPTALQWEEIDATIAAGGVAASIDETQYDALRAVVRALESRLRRIALGIAYNTLARHTRPALTVTDEPQPTKRSPK
jgi:hypothetical protein